MRWLPRLLCQHNTIQIQRSHKDVCRPYHGQQAWEDIHGCYNFFVCSDCKTVLKSSQPNWHEIYPRKPS